MDARADELEAQIKHEHAGDGEEWPHRDVHADDDQQEAKDRQPAEANRQPDQQVRVRDVADHAQVEQGSLGPFAEDGQKRQHGNAEQAAACERAARLGVACSSASQTGWPCCAASSLRR